MSSKVARRGTPEAQGGIYIGRPSIYGNPYMIGRDGTRDEVIEKFRIYFYGRLETDPAFHLALRQLIDRTLICHCTPKPCHGDIIADYLTSLEKAPAPCQCHQTWAYVAPTHPGHCCFIPASQTCHPDEVAKWETERERRRLG